MIQFYIPWEGTNNKIQYFGTDFFFLFLKLQVWTQKCAVQKASMDVNISYY
jgi:hypothetical protein